MTALLIDGNNVLMRAIHAMQRPGQASRLGVDGVPTGPLLVFINSLSKHIREERPDKVVIAWDGGKSAYRLAIDPDYKGQRNPAPEFEELKEGSFGLAKEFLSLANIHHVERRGHEADDVIAYYWRHNRPLAQKVVIVSSDKDFLQLLVDGEVEQVRLGSYDTPTDRWTATRVQEEMGCKPAALVDAMALAGDTSDNIPGVPRFGMKTAIKTLAKYPNLDSAIHLDERLSPHRERIEKNHRLVDLIGLHDGLDLDPLPPFQPTQPGHVLWADLLAFLTRYQMKSVSERLYDGSLWHPAP